MTIVKKLKKKKSIEEPVKKKSIAGRSKMTISKVPNVPSDDLESYPLLIHGRRGIGKTTLISQFKDMHFAMFENNKSYPFYMNSITNWEDFIDYVEDFMKGNHKFLGTSLDNPKNCYDLAMDYACLKFGFDHPGAMNDHGDSWNKVKKTFTTPIRRLMNSNYGFLVSCHSIEKKITRSDGVKYDMIAPDLSGQAYGFLCGEMYNIFYYFYESKQRWLQIVGDEYVVAKNRMKGHFIAKDGKPVFKIPMGDNEEESYNNLIKAFDNKQEKSYQPVKVEFKKKKKVKED